MVITVVLGIAIALLIDEPFPGRGLVRVLLISPFFVMPTVSALLWEEHDDEPDLRRAGAGLEPSSAPRRSTG